MSTEIRLIVDETALLATRTYEAVLATRRFGNPADSQVLVYEDTVTANYWPAFVSAGLVLSDLYGLRADTTVTIVKPAAARLETEPEHRTLIRLDNSAVAYAEMMALLSRLMRACAENPDATFYTS